MDDKSNVEAALGFAKANLLKPEIKTVSVPERGLTGAFLLAPDGMALHDVKKYIDAYRLRPERRKGTATFLKAESFIEQTNAFKGESSRIFATAGDLAASKMPSVTAVVNYNGLGYDAEPEFGDHRFTFNPPLSDEWKRWLGQNGTKMQQAEFAEFLEDSVVDMLPPPDLRKATGGVDEAVRMLVTAGGVFGGPADILTLAKGLNIRVAVDTMEAVTLSSGEVEFRYGEKHTDDRGKPLRVPTLFQIAIPIFKDGPRYNLFARLRYRLIERRVTWWFTLFRPEVRFDLAFDEMIEKVKAETALPVLIGTPENCSGG